MKFTAVQMIGTQRSGSNLLRLMLNHLKEVSAPHFADLLEEEINPYYIFLYRDGRDVASSFKRAVVGEKHVYHIAKQWQYEQDLCLKLYHQLGDKRVIRVCYKNLISSPERELKRVCEFIGARYNNACLEYYNSQEAKNTASSGKMWQNVKRKVLTDNFNNYKKDFSADEIILFEKIAGTTLQALNYTLNFPIQNNNEFSITEIKMYDEINHSLKQKAKQQQKPGDAEKRLMQEALINNIRKKLNYISYNKVEKIAV
jgi:hypothetical protein